MEPQPRCADLTPFTLADADPATGTVKLHFDAQPLFANHFDKVQGGFAVAMIDAVLSVAGWVKTGTWLPTLNLMANFVAPLEVGPITGIGTVTKIGKSIASSKADSSLPPRPRLQAVFVVCAPRARTDLKASLARISTSLPGISIDWLNAEDVLSLHRHSDTAHLALRYDLRLE